jgi:hypothetical protein
VSRSYRFRRGGLPARVTDTLFPRLAPGHTREDNIIDYGHGYVAHRLARCACGLYHHNILTDPVVPFGVALAELVGRGWPPRIAASHIRYDREGWWYQHEDRDIRRLSLRAYRRRVRTAIAGGHFDDLDAIAQYPLSEDRW